MSINGVSGSYGYYDAYANTPRKKAQTSFKGQPTMMAQPTAKPKEKTGFWECVGAFCKGLVKPVVNMVKHPIATTIGIAAVAALIIGTGGAATPFLLAAGIGLGAWQAGKGVVNAITADTREETLKALEDVGEGTFALATSAIGAKNYAAGLKSASTASTAAKTGETVASTASEAASTAGEAAAAASKPSMFAQIVTYIKDSKSFNYLKDVKTGVVETVKAAPDSYRTSMAMIKSGEFTGNLKSAAGSAKLAWQHKQLDKLKGISDENIVAKTARDRYEVKSHIFKNKVDDTCVKIQRRYLNEWKDLWAKGQLDTPYGKMITKLAFENRKLVNVPDLAAVKNGLNPKTHIPEAIATGITAGYFNGDGDEYIPQEQEVQIPYSYPYQYYPSYDYGA